MFINIAHAVEAETKLTYAFPGEPATVADPGQYINTVFTFALGIVGLAALAFLVYGGIRYILSAGNPSALADAKDRMTAALIGIVLLLSSYLILNTIDPRLLELTITDVQPATPKLGGLSAALQAYKNEVLRYISEGNAAAAAQIMKEVLQAEGSEELRKLQTDLAKTEPTAAAETYRAMDRAGQINWLAKQLQENLGELGNIPQLEGYEEMLQQIPVEDLHRIYYGFQGKSQEDIFKRLSDSQREGLYWKFGEDDPTKRKQEIYLSQLTDDHVAQIYQNFKATGAGQDAHLVRQLVTTSIGTFEQKRAVVGTWSHLPPGERQAFIDQAVSNGWKAPVFQLETRGFLQRSNPGISDDAAEKLVEELEREWGISIRK